VGIPGGVLTMLDDKAGPRCGRSIASVPQLPRVLLLIQPELVNGPSFRVSGAERLPGVQLSARVYALPHCAVWSGYVRMWRTAVPLLLTGLHSLREGVGKGGKHAKDKVTAAAEMRIR
jgi:hypothetical protein